MNFQYLRKDQSGAILVLALLFLTILTFVGLSLVGLVAVQSKLAYIKVAREYSFQIAEAGLNYARWRLAHNNDDLTSETKVLEDPEGGTIGSYTVDFVGGTASTNIVNVKSTGWYQTDVNLRRILSARYGKKAFTFYAFLFDSPVWFGGDSVDGRVHSNKGIRIDSIANSKITSAKETYTCTYIHGCNPPTTKPGIWGTGEPKDLWEFPVSNIDFNGVTTDLATLKDLTENQGVGLFLSKAGVPKGYDLNFLANGKVEVYKVKKVGNPIDRYRWEDNKWKKYNKSLDILDRELLQIYTLQENDLIFVETDLWVRGTVNGRVTVVSASLPDVSENNTNIILSNNITYNSYDGNTVFGLIAQKNILISLLVPNDMQVDAVLMAQKGFIGRDYYPADNDPSDDIDYTIRNSIITYGSMISKDFSDPEFRWVYADGTTASGFENNYNYYDSYLTYNPPPYFPVTGNYDFISWEEKEE